MSLIKKLRFTKRRPRSLVNNMLVAGVFPHQLPHFDFRKYAWTVFSIFSLSYVVIFTTYNMRLKTSFMVKVSTLKTVLSAFMCLVVVLLTMYKSRDLCTLIDYVEQNFYKYTDESRFKYKFSVSRRSENILIYTSALFFIGIYSSAILSHPIYLLFNRGLLQSKSKMLIHTWVPWKGDTIFSFYLAHAALIIVTIPVVMTIVGNVSFILNVYLEFKDQFERLMYALNTIPQRTKWRSREVETGKQFLPGVVAPSPFSDEGSSQFSPNENKMFEAMLIECVQHYKIIIKSFKYFKNWFELTYSIILAHSVLTLAMMSYGALLNEELVKVVYNVPWYRQPPQGRQIFYIFLCQVQRPFLLTGIRIYPASFNVFSSIMKLSYSYLNLLRTYGGSSLRKS